MKNTFLLALIGIALLACQSGPNAEEIIQQSIANSGGEAYDNSTISFDFRTHHYVVMRKAGEWEMRRIKTDSTGITMDRYSAQNFTRSKSGKAIEVADSMIAKYKESINSVFYFALLPYKLDDAAVIAERLEDEKIEGKKYYKVEVRFEENGGGKDFQDVFIYWFDQTDFSIDYLAYSYETDDGGLRFRKAYNERVIEGIRFVDYINYEAPKEMELESLAVKFEAGELKELSRIELENLMVSR
ncbi:MAG: deoxyribose-phosphate aldolase [Flavobacteriales bacterium]|nr:deoxyribose-phosphate aldolase [Flavobacteriales bacterium]